MPIITVSNTGGNWNAGTTWVGGVVPSATLDTVAFTSTSGQLTVNVPSTCIGIRFTNYVNTITFTTTLTINGPINLGTGGYTQAGASGLIAGATSTLTSGGVTWSRLFTFAGASQTFTLADNWTISGNITINGTTSVIINGNTLNIGGNLTQTTTAIVSGTTAFNFNGTGTWSNSSTGSIRNNTTINTTGTLTIGTNVYYDTGTLTRTSGTVITTGSTLNIGAATTLTTNGITWNNINTTTGVVITLGSNLTLTGTLSLGNGVTSFTLGGFNLISTNANLTMLGVNAIFTMPANQTFKSLTITGTNATLNANTLTITGNLTINAGVSGTTTIVYGGTGTWTALNTTSLISNILTINTPGTLTISGIVYKQLGLFTYTTGTIIDTTGTVSVQSITLNLSGFTFRKLLVNNTITLTSNINATTFGTWGANVITFTLGAFSLNFTNLELGNTGITTLPTAWVCQNIEFANGGTGTLNTNSITINGNILQSSIGIYGGTTTFTYAGTGSWTSTSTGYFSNTFNINTAGTLTFISGNIGGGTFTYTSGTVVTTSSTLTINVSTTLNTNGITWNNVTLSNTAIYTYTINSPFVGTGTLTIGTSTSTIFAGTAGFTFGILTNASTVATSVTLVNGLTYTITSSLNCFTTRNGSSLLFTSNHATLTSNLIFSGGATCNVLANFTRINASGGRPIMTFNGTLVGCSNIIERHDFVTYGY